MQKAICRFDILAAIFPESLCKYASNCESTIYCQAYAEKNERAMNRFARMQKAKEVIA
jgi:hypothetical protein